VVARTEAPLATRRDRPRPLVVLRTTVDGPQETTIADDAALYRQLRADRPAASLGYVTDVGFCAPTASACRDCWPTSACSAASAPSWPRDVAKARTSRHLCTSDVNQLAADLRPRTLVPLHLSKAYVRNPRALYRELAPPQATRLLELPNYVTARPLLLTELPRFDRSIRQAETLPCMEVPDD